MDGPMEPYEQGQLLKSLRDKGLDPATVISCAPRAGKFGIPGVHGCAHYGSCIFGLKRYGGFKGEPGGFIPHNIVYEIKPHDGTNNQKEDTLACFLFMQTLYRKMQAGRRAREEGLPGEEINIIGGEGDEYLSGFYGRSKDWHPVTNNMSYSDQVEKKVCPPYKVMGITSGDSYAAQVERRRKARAAETDDDRPLARRTVELPAEVPQASAEPKGPASPEELDMVLGATVVVAEPAPTVKEPKGKASAAPAKESP